MKKITIVLLNAPTILHEVMQAARVRLASSLELPLEYVKLELKRGDDDERVYPAVDIDIPQEVKADPPQTKFFSKGESWAMEVIGQVMRQALREYKTRREGAGV